MAEVFVSSCRVDEVPAATLIDRLCAESFTVSHSPRAATEGGVTSWADWYGQGCRSTLEKATVFIAVVTSGWEYSTWMRHEVGEALSLLESGRIRRLYSWNPGPDELGVKGVMPQFEGRLPEELDELVARLRADLKEVL